MVVIIKNGYEYARAWQYNGVALLGEINQWCWTHFGQGHRERCWTEYETIYFAREDDYTLFLLRWA